MNHDPDHPTFSKEARRRRDLDAADLRAVNTWMRAEVEAMNAARWAARRDAAVCVLTWSTLAGFWLLVLAIVVAVVW